MTWHLPCSKTDPRALGVHRTWDCTCTIPSLGFCCPVHAALRQLHRVRILASKLGLDANMLPLFPNSKGEECTKYVVVATIKNLVQSSGYTLVDAGGRHLYGGIVLIKARSEPVQNSDHGEVDLPIGNSLRRRRDSRRHCLRPSAVVVFGNIGTPGAHQTCRCLGVSHTGAGGETATGP